MKASSVIDDLHKLIYASIFGQDRLSSRSTTFFAAFREKLIDQILINWQNGKIQGGEFFTLL